MIVPGWPSCKLLTSTLLDVPPPLAVIKVHGIGLDWWRELDQPETWELECFATKNSEGRHFMYEVPEGLFIPLASIQDIIVDTVTRHFTRVPPSDTKRWVRQVKPAMLRPFEVPQGRGGMQWLGTHTPWMAVYGTHLID